jgi:hypothetical protein
MLPTRAELRDQSRRFRAAASKSTDPAIKRSLARYALMLAQVAEVIERDRELGRKTKPKVYERVLARAVG